MKIVLLVMIMISAIMGNVFPEGQQDAGNGARPTLELLQNKVEIDPQLKAYAKAWGDRNGLMIQL